MCRITIVTESLHFAGRGAVGEMGDVKLQGSSVDVISPESVSQPEEVMGRGSRLVAEDGQEPV